MPIVILEDQILSKLASVNEPVELCTKDGTRIGFFTPSSPAKYVLEPQISEEEIRIREQRTGGRTLTEIFADLEKQV